MQLYALIDMTRAVNMYLFLSEVDRNQELHW